MEVWWILNEIVFATDPGNLTEYGAQLIETDGDFTFTGVQILTSPTDILEPDTLYVCTPKVLPKLKKQLLKTTASFSRPNRPSCSAIMRCTASCLTKTPTSTKVVNRLITHFTQFHAF